MAQVEWDPGPARPSLSDGTVDVWRVDLADPALDVAALGRLLSDAERERAARFVRSGDGERWTTAHAVLRALLGAYLDADPRALRFGAGPHGKPALVDHGPPAAARGSRPDGPAREEGGAANVPRLRFNLSHSADVALFAFAFDREVGVDVELPRRAVDHVAIARRILGEAEAARLAALDSPQREREFLRAWVRWEALLKCRGTGIGGADNATGGPEPWIRELDVGPPGAAALAVAGGPVEVRCWRWPAAEPGWLPTISRP